MALLCVGGAANTKKRFIAASSGAKVSIAEETDKYAITGKAIAVYDYATFSVKLKI